MGASCPNLDYAADHGTWETLHLMTRIVGKTRLAASPYDRVAAAGGPGAAVQAFLAATYGAAADGGAWDRAALECGIGRPGIPRAVA